MTSTILWDKRSDERLLLQLSAVVIEAAVRPWCGATIFLQIIGYYYYPEIGNYGLFFDSWDPGQKFPVECTGRQV
jgi:hypothetical protein